MKGKKLLAIVFVATALILLLASLIYNYRLKATPDPYALATEVNNYIDVSGVKLLMTKEEADKKIGEDGGKVAGFGAKFYHYDQSQVEIAFPINGPYKGKVNYISTLNPAHSILGIRVGDSVDKVKAVLEKYEFKPHSKSKGFFVRGNVEFAFDDKIINGKPVIWLMQITVHDMTPMDGTY